MNSRNTRFTMAVGGCLIVAAAILANHLFVSGYTRFTGTSIPADSTVYAYNQRSIPEYVAGAIPIAVNHIMVTAPRAMKIDETETVVVTVNSYSYTLQDPSQTYMTDRIYYSVPLPENATITLSSPAFAIEPSETQTLRDDETGSAECKWLIAPESEGRHRLLLDISKLLWNASEGSRLTNSLSLNDEEIAVGAGQLQLMVNVFTIWGIRRTTFNIIRAGIGVFGFLLTLPLIRDIIARLIKKSSRKETG